MQQVVSPLAPFPNMYWWVKVAGYEHIIFDEAEHFAKMSYRNKYFITGANGQVQLSVPLAGGRNQRKAMRDVLIDNKEEWQVQHWRTIYSVYGRAPYFEHYAPVLKQLYKKKYDTLVAFNRATIDFLNKELKMLPQVTTADEYKLYSEDVTDLRRDFKPGTERTAIPESEGLYYQLFSERNGFYPNLSLLDVLLCEGPATKLLLQQNREKILQWR